MPSFRFGQQSMPTLVVAVLLLHALALWALQGGLLQRAAATEPAVVQLSFVATPTPVSKPAMERTPPAPKPARPAPAAVPAIAKPAAPVPVVPVPVAAAAPATATALPVAAQGLVVPIAPAGASTALSQTSGAAAAAATPTAMPAATSKVLLPTVDADYLYAPKLEYPRMSVKLNEHGRVLINVYIGTDGQAQKAEVKNSSGYTRLDQAALAFALGQRFVPGKVGGVPEAMWYTVPVKFGFND